MAKPIDKKEMEQRRQWVYEAERTHAQARMQLDAAGKAVMAAFIAGEFELSELIPRMKALSGLK